MKELLRWLARAVHTLLPKRSVAVLWSEPDYEDSVLALESALQGTSVERVVVLVADRRHIPPVELGPKTVVVAKYTVRGWLTFATARYVFFTHRCFARQFPRRVIAVNVWHGMPIKRIGWMLEGDQGVSGRYSLATSPFWEPILQQSMRPSHGVLVTGLPRNDRLFGRGPDDWRGFGFEADDAEPARRIVWLPTYRRSTYGYMTVDGEPTGSPFEMALDPEELNELLRANNATCVLKPHPMTGFTGTRSWSHLAIIDDAHLRQHRLSLYQVVGAADVLISDVSSVTIDYLVLDRPIVHAISDLEAYGATRGFSISPIGDHLMGPVASSYEELASTLTEVLAGGDPDADRRRRMRELWHTHCDDMSTQRLLAAVGPAPIRGSGTAPGADQPAR